MFIEVVISYTRLKKQFNEIIARVCAENAHTRFIITRNKEPIAVLLSIEDYNKMMNTVMNTD